MFVACKPKAPVKAAHCKVILDTDFAAQPLTEVFGDFLFAYQQSGEFIYLRKIYSHVVFLFAVKCLCASLLNALYVQ